MSNLNSKSEFFEGKKVYDYTTHYRMPKVKATKKKRRKTAYKSQTPSNLYINNLTN